jgi:hypothetical protein
MPDVSMRTDHRDVAADVTPEVPSAHREKSSHDPEPEVAPIQAKFMTRRS